MHVNIDIAMIIHALFFNAYKMGFMFRFCFMIKLMYQVCAGVVEIDSAPYTYI